MRMIWAGCCNWEHVLNQRRNESIAVTRHNGSDAIPAVFLSASAEDIGCSMLVLLGRWNP